jgi:hypothetical protein
MTSANVSTVGNSAEMCKFVQLKKGTTLDETTAVQNKI